MGRDEETARYRQAAQLTLDQLEWCVHYLASIRKYGLSQQLAKNHASIRPADPGPADGPVLSDARLTPFDGAQTDLEVVSDLNAISGSTRLGAGGASLIGGGKRYAFVAKSSMRPSGRVRRSGWP